MAPIFQGSRIFAFALYVQIDWWRHSIDFTHVPMSLRHAPFSIPAISVYLFRHHRMPCLPPARPPTHPEWVPQWSSPPTPFSPLALEPPHCGTMSSAAILQTPKRMSLILQIGTNILCVAFVYQHSTSRRLLAKIHAKRLPLLMGTRFVSRLLCLSQQLVFYEGLRHGMCDRT